MPLDECPRCENRYPTFVVRWGMLDCYARCKVCDYNGPKRRTIDSAELAWNKCCAKIRRECEQEKAND